MELASEILSDLAVWMKYARYLPNKKRRENWNDIVTRNVIMHTNKFPDLATEIKEAFIPVYANEVLPSMRMCQFAGKPVEVNPTRGYNCLSRETKFITSEGLRSFSDFKAGDVVSVLTHKGRYKDAVVRSYGTQSLNKVTFKKGRSEAVVRCTSDHRWLLKDGSETNSLKVGDGLAPVSFFNDFDYESADLPEKLAWAYGFVYGDGTKFKGRNGEYKGSGIRLCGNDSRFKDRFLELGFKISNPFSFAGDDCMVYTGKYLKKLPDPTKDSVEVIKAFMHGYMQADGAKNSCKESASMYKSVQTSKDHDEIRDLLAICGFFVTGEDDYTGQETNYGVRPKTIRFRGYSSYGKSPLSFWHCKKIEEDVSSELVWCLEVEDDHSFVLESGLVTGNCAYMPIDAPEAFSEAMFLLLGGTGVGFSVQKAHVKSLPKIRGNMKPQGRERKKRYLIGDSIEGWADSIKILVQSYFQCKREIDFDFRDIRKKGALLITSGGKAPGPEPLRVCLAQITSIFENALQLRGVGSRLTSLECHDIICIIADAVLAGGIRRAALISLFSKDDQEMLFCKSGRWWETAPWRGRCNNSAVFLRSRAKKEDFTKFWDIVKGSGSGEPGIYFTNDVNFGTNPCCEIALRPFQMCVSGDTKLITECGINTIENLVGKKVKIWNGSNWSSVTPYQTGNADRLHRVWFSDGSYLDATDNHKFLIKNRFQKDFEEVDTIDLIDRLQESKYGLQIPRSNIHYDEGSPCDTAYDHGFILGDGCVHKGYVEAQLFGEKKALKFVTSKHIGNYNNVEGTEFTTVRFKLNAGFCHSLKYDSGLHPTVFKWDKPSILQFVAGWADADGSSSSKGIRIYGREDKIRDGQLLLSKIGINSSVNLMAKEGEVTNKGVRTKDVWYLQITQTIEIPCQRLVCNNSEDCKYKGKYQIIKRVCTLDNAHKSFCLTELELNQCVFGNVLTKQCNLSEINASTIKTQEDLNSRAKAASVIGTLQASYTDFHYLRDVWQETCEKDALLGVSMTGICSGGVSKLNLQEATDIVIKENIRVSKLIGINSAARATCIKPAGTTSLKLGCSSGVHAWHNDYYIRSLRVNKTESIYPYLVNNFPDLIEDEKFKPNQEAVIGIPQKAPAGAILRSESALDTLERVKKFSLEWVKPGHVKGPNTHNVSCTISIKDTEWEPVGKWMWDNREIYNGIAVMPHDGGTYVQAPFQDCSKSKYYSMLKSLKNINLDEVIEHEDSTNLSGEVACGGHGCAVV